MEFVRAAFLLAVYTIALAAACSPSISETMEASSSVDQIEPIGSLANSQVAVFTSSKAGLRLQKHKSLFKQSSDLGSAHIEVNPNERFQSIKGFGGALTDASAINLDLVEANVRDAILRSYFGPDGAGYTLARVPIASCDFSTSQYSYCEHEGDFEMSKFSIEMDREKKLPLILDAKRLERNLHLIASTWSPPSWMKDGSIGMVGGTLKKDKLTRDAYATYLSKFLSSYEAEGAKIWAMTVENEPTKLFLIPRLWQSMNMSPEDAQQFIVEHLGPTLKRSHPELKLFINDDNSPFMKHRAQVLIGDSKTDSPAKPYVSGIAFHWYFSLDCAFPRFGEVSEMAKMYPDLLLINTEACTGDLPWSRGVKFGNWERGESYAHDIIGDLNAGAHGWIDWNIVLDIHGGPNWAKNYVDSPIIIDPDTPDRFYKQPMWFALTHISRFVRPGSVRIGCKVAQAWRAHLHVACFHTPSNRIVMLILNRSRFFDVSTSVSMPGITGTLDLSVKRNSISTVVFDAPASSI